MNKWVDITDERNQGIVQYQKDERMTGGQGGGGEGERKPETKKWKEKEGVWELQREMNRE